LIKKNYKITNTAFSGLWGPLCGALAWANVINMPKSSTA